MKLKPNRLLIVFCFCLFCQNLFAQTGAMIASDLSKLFQKLDGFDIYNHNIELIDTLNSQIDSKISFYIKTAPGGLAAAFPKLGAATSADGVLAILSWDTQMGGTQHYFNNLFLIKTNGRFKYINSETSTQDDEYSCCYNGIYCLTVGNKTYYLATYESILHVSERMEGIKVFSVEDGKLNDKVKLIKTHEGFNYRLRYRYFVEEEIGGMNYYPKSKEITFPLINEKGRMAGDSIVYKFNGKYFEKVKS
jgi:hypothetical protein